MKYEEKPKVGVGVYIIKNGKILLGERIGSHQSNTYSAPGGKLEYGESWEQCAKRETKEETGLEIENVKFLGVTNDVMPKDNKHYITIAMIANLKSGEPEVLEPNKCLGWGWYELDNIPVKKALFLENFLNSSFSNELKNTLKDSK